jgi:polar amino acid transport system substrate-binding protein
MSPGRLGTVVLAVLALGLAAGCDATRERAEQNFVPVSEGVLTVATALPAPGFWAGETAAAVDGGFEYVIAVELAARFGLDLRLVDVPFEELVAGELGGADLALAQITVTDGRDSMLDFSQPYYRDGVGVVLRRDETMADLRSAREATWAVESGSVQYDYLVAVVRPGADPVIVADEVAAVAAVARGTAEAALLDLSTALVLTNGRDDVTTAARFDVAQDFAVALPPGSPNRQVVDAALRSFEASGLLGRLKAEYLLPAFERDPSSLTVIRTPG